MKYEVTPFFAIIILIFVLIASFIICFSIKPTNYDESRTKVFITSLAGLGIFITFLFYYSVVDLQQQQKKQAKIQETTKITDSIQDSFILNVEKYYNKIPKFTSTLLPLLHIEDNFDINTNDECECENQVDKYVLSYQIFSLWQNMIISNDFIAIDKVSLIAGALQRAHSKPLLVYWEKIKIDFSEKVQIFGNLLFEYSSKIKIQNTENYEIMAKEFVHDKRYKKLLL